MLLDSNTLAAELAAWAHQTTTTPPDQATRIQKAEARLEELNRQRDRLTDAYQMGALALEVFRTRVQAVEEGRVAAELALAELKASRMQLELAGSRVRAAHEFVSTLTAKLLDTDFNTQQTITGAERYFA